MWFLKPFLTNFNEFYDKKKYQFSAKLRFSSTTSHHLVQYNDKFNITFFFVKSKLLFFIIVSFPKIFFRNLAMTLKFNYTSALAAFGQLLKVELGFPLSLRVGKCIQYLHSTDSDKYAPEKQGMYKVLLQWIQKLYWLKIWTLTHILILNKN